MINIREVCPDFWGNYSDIKNAEATIVTVDFSVAEKALTTIKQHFPTTSNLINVRRVRKKNNSADILVKAGSLNTKELEILQKAFIDLDFELKISQTTIPQVISRSRDELKAISNINPWPIMYRKGFLKWLPSSIKIKPNSDLLAVLTSLSYSSSQVEKNQYCSMYCTIFIDGNNVEQIKCNNQVVLGHAVFHAVSNFCKKIISARHKVGLTSDNINYDSSCFDLPSDDHIKPEQYYLTNCEVVLTSEPCYMCAMALVHSRISRCFIKIEPLESTVEHCVYDINHETQTVPLDKCHRFKTTGAFFSENSLLFNHSLNHHFKTYVVY